jgi:oligopeptide transport system substrate-binding protein
MVEDATTELQMFEEGTIDWAGPPLSIKLPSDAIPSLKKQGHLHITPISATYFFLFDLKHPLLKNQKIRQALSYTIDREGIVKSILGTGELAITSIVPPELSIHTTPFYDNSERNQARALFDEGLAELELTRDEIPDLSLSYNTSLHHHRIAQYLQQQWSNALGITVKLNSTEWKVYLGKINSCDFDMARLSWIADFSDATSFLNLMRYTNNGVNCMGWTDPDYLALLDQADFTLNADDRAKLLFNAEKILAEQMPIAPVFRISEAYVKNPRLKGVVLSNPTIIDFKWAYLEPEQ